ncbi:uncharacterized protein LOC124499790 [Dermatophagoides farinae]|uniref:Uncharacterized protein n=1 Tax=Dermatophagoides farinae TaxID=6954 RepID=A0A922L0L7_DERFA|nr:uncharacterized protein LOC124499790 [Dermatophagoides farinae]KAH7645647.1 hypothetical protein HUG17_1185 [Dermatophagoides farinae]KAH9490516.1 hypothetical protein DERF_016714 [Dermatophagoides farinae]
MRIYNTISLKRISIILSTFILLINDQLDYGHTADEQCNCSVEKNGEYCGTQLNELNKENSCPKKMFYCGDTNHNKAAVLLVDCQQGQECDVRTLLSNACLKNIECECPKGLTKGQTYCGDSLTGKDCSPNITFTCPRLSMIFHPSPVDACLYGCKDGVCLSAPSK